MEFFIDTYGRLVKPPDYTAAELNSYCDKLILFYMQKHLGAYEWPIPTDVLIKLIECHASDLDLYADLSEEGEGIAGVTYVYSDQIPEVKISRELSEQDCHKHVLRRTLAHEFAHAFFHGYFWYGQTPVFDIFSSDTNTRVVYKCRQCREGEAESWAESQAEFAAGAVLMPGTPLVLHLAHPYRIRHNLHWPVKADTEHANRLIDVVAEYFDVCRFDASQRLVDLKIVVGDIALGGW